MQWTYSPVFRLSTSPCVPLVTGLASKSLMLWTQAVTQALVGKCITLRIAFAGGVVRAWHWRSAQMSQSTIETSDTKPLRQMASGDMNGTILPSCSICLRTEHARCLPAALDCARATSRSEPCLHRHTQALPSETTVEPGLSMRSPAEYHVTHGCVSVGLFMCCVCDQTMCCACDQISSAACRPTISSAAGAVHTGQSGPQSGATRPAGLAHLPSLADSTRPEDCWHWNGRVGRCACACWGGGGGGGLQRSMHEVPQVPGSRYPTCPGRS